MHSPRPFPLSACHRCAGSAYTGGRLGQLYLRCELLPERYPRQPVLRCPALQAPPLALLRLWPPLSAGDGAGDSAEGSAEGSAESPLALPLRWLGAAAVTGGAAGGGVRWRGTLGDPLEADALALLTAAAPPRPSQHPGWALTLEPAGEVTGAARAAPFALRWREELGRGVTLAVALRPPSARELDALRALHTRAELLL